MIGCRVVRSSLPRAFDGNFADRPMPHTACAVTSPLDVLLPCNFNLSFLHLMDEGPIFTDEGFYNVFRDRACGPRNVEYVEKVLAFQAKWNDIKGMSNEAEQLMFL